MAKTICGIDITLLANGPTPDEVAALVAGQYSDWQAYFIDALARHFNAMGVGRDRQISFITARIIASCEDAPTFIHDLEWWLNNETKKKHEEELAVP